MVHLLACQLDSLRAHLQASQAVNLAVSPLRSPAACPVEFLHRNLRCSRAVLPLLSQVRVPRLSPPACLLYSRPPFPRRCPLRSPAVSPVELLLHPQRCLQDNPQAYRVASLARSPVCFLLASQQAVRVLNPRAFRHQNPQDSRAVGHHRSPQASPVQSPHLLQVNQQLSLLLLRANHQHNRLQSPLATPFRSFLRVGLPLTSAPLPSLVRQEKHWHPLIKK